ncbi:hypothetical protein DC498_06895 [Terrimonas sp.]|uniref:DUF7935 family protein n=1 Tax=Terrimonas sp. TaxID=1914338 RepID=UPI000D51D1CC|nr:hypothetical protein [Terrimonas sp.]PVD53085.1 hypothetical protein DC498_06895 [Terrimonas sp.]
MLSNTAIIIIAVVIIICFLALYFFTYRTDIKIGKELEKKSVADSALQLQAYERLTILTERISLKNLLSRISPADMQVGVYQSLLVESIKQEYEYNLSQQLYVSNQVWEALTNLKEQNIFIIHQLAGTLPANAPGIELSKRMLELLDADPKTSLHFVVLDALKFEAGKIMKGK